MTPLLALLLAGPRAASATPWAFSVAPLPTHAPALALAVVGERQLALSDGVDTWILDPTDGAVLHTLSWPAGALSTGTLDGGPALVGCGEAGLWWAALSDGAPGAVQELSSVPCQAVVVGALGEEEALLVAQVDLLRLLRPGEEGWAAEEVVGTWTGEVLLAAGGGELAAARLGAEAFTVLQAETILTWDIGAPLSGVGQAAGTWWAALPEHDAIRSIDGDLRTLDLSPSAMVTGDLDGDGQSDLVVLDGAAQAARVLTLSLTTRIEGLPAGPATVGDLDGDGCGDLIVLDTAGAGHAAWAQGCPNPADRDGDGWPEVDGDCDDLDPQTYPYAPELCDDVDQDCDGVVPVPEPPTLSWQDYQGSSAELSEADFAPTQVRASSGGCGLAGWTWTWEVSAVDADGEGLGPTCTALGDTATCEPLDDGSLTVLARLIDPSGAPWGEVSDTRAVSEAPPVLSVVDLPLEDGVLLMDGSGPLTVQFALSPQGDEPAAWMVDGPPWVTGTDQDMGGWTMISLVLDPPAGDRDVTVDLIAWDDPYQQSWFPFEVVVDGPEAEPEPEPRPPAQEPACGCAAGPSPVGLAGLLAVVALAGARRRRR